MAPIMVPPGPQVPALQNGDHHPWLVKGQLKGQGCMKVLDEL